MILRGADKGVCIIRWDFNEVFTRVGTYVQRGSKFCFVVLVLVLVLGTFVRILQYMQN
jgi:hypothetical protein